MESQRKRVFGNSLGIKVAPNHHAVRVGGLFWSRRAFEKALLDRISELNSTLDREFTFEDIGDIFVYVQCAHIFRACCLLRHIYSPTENSCKCPAPNCWSHLFWPGNTAGPYNKSALIKNVNRRTNEKALKTILSKFGDIEDFEVDRQKRSIFVDFKTTIGYKAAVAANPHKLGEQLFLVEERGLATNLSIPFMDQNTPDELFFRAIWQRDLWKRIQNT
ncbi:hypothetical protein BU16DRAFT_544719 [Lophium mytilinum]|uniref:RRM domain-containing protein n=1 Tax=Lophium mytilinum TaxID=390894 RepID=A0A6A6QB88_9PEZI|nr:hypothetical protein BU16DRAFT_544719 [Lophium mytilinum]